MGLFRRGKTEPQVEGAGAPVGAGEGTRLDRSAIAAVLAHLESERDALNARAAAEYGTDAVAAWSLDLDTGSMTFTTEAGHWSGSIEVLGSWNAGAESWMWGWANAGVSDALTTASFGVNRLGEDKAIPSLTTMTLWADEAEAQALAALAFGYAESPFLFVTPTNPAIFLAVRDIVPVA